MRTHHWNRWLIMSGVIAGCNAKLSVEPGTDGSGGYNAGHGGYSAGSGGKIGGTLVNAGNAGRSLAGTSSEEAGASESGGADNHAGAQNYAGHAGADNKAGSGNYGGDNNHAGAGSYGGADGHAGAGNYGGSDYGGAGNRPGMLGADCIPGTTADDGDGVSKTQLKTFDHCDPGLACNNEGTCVAIPACPGDGDVCALQSPLGAGGAGGTNGGLQGTGGAILTAAGSYNSSVPDERGVTAIAVDSSHLYWLEYGTRDSLGNYQNNGALKAMALPSGDSTVLASGLAGPNALAVTSGFAYVFIDGAGVIGSAVHRKLLRVPLSGGSAQPVQDGTPPLSPYTQESFVAAGAKLYWSGTDALYSLADDETVPTAVATTATQSLHADSTSLYFIDGNTNLFSSTPLTGGTTTSLALEARPFDLNGDSIYGLESAYPGILLTQAAKSNGSWLRIQALGNGYPNAPLVFVGDRFFFLGAQVDYYYLTAIKMGQLGAHTPIVALQTLDTNGFTQWVPTADKLYWTDGWRIYARAIPTP